MTYIFLDIDGVLNCDKTTQRCMGFTGIDPALVENLKYIVDQTGAEIILTSTWKYYWEPNGAPGMDEMGKYLDRMLADAGLRITAMTEDSGLDRGQGIADFLLDNPADAWVVLDDIYFNDFSQFGIEQHLVLTCDDENGDAGLTQELAIQAVHMIEEQLRCEER